MKKWENPQVVELELENTESGQCTADFKSKTPYPEFLAGCIWYGKYEPGRFGICKHYDTTAPGDCELNREQSIS